MAFMPWSQKYMVDITEIDAQHIKLFDLINELHASMMGGQSSATVGRTIDGLVDYVRLHFNTEERLFARHGYTDSAAHKREHEEFTKRVLDFQAQYHEGASAISVELVEFLVTWLKNHVMGSDKKYAPFMKLKGVS